MQIITKRDLIRGIAAHWYASYKRYIVGDDPTIGLDKRTIYAKLLALDVNTATEAEVAAIIGNSSWIDNRCHECGRQCDLVIEVGEPSCYDSCTAQLCPECLAAATKMVQDAQ